MCLKRCGAVRADDPEVLETIVVADAVDVVEDQRQTSAIPCFVLAAEFADRALDTLVVEPLLEVAPAKR
jgi:hypothetical protein